MKKYLSVLKQSKLFYGVKEEEILLMLDCLDAKLHTYQKGEYVFRQGERLNCIMILTEGNLYVQRDDFWGNRSIIQQISVGEMFGEAYVAADSGAIMNDVIAMEESSVVFLNVGKILSVCSSACRFHTMVVQNLFYAISEKNRQLIQKIGHISKRTTREKLLSYLSDQAKRKKSRTFEIPFNRQQLADFLSVDRSAMSNELGKMQKEGILNFEKNRFTLL